MDLMLIYAFAGPGLLTKTILKRMEVLRLEIMFEFDANAKDPHSVSQTKK